jgi:hypothetical protein
MTWNSHTMLINNIRPALTMLFLNLHVSRIRIYVTDIHHKPMHLQSLMFYSSKNAVDIGWVSFPCCPHTRSLSIRFFSRDSSVGIATRLWTGRPRSRGWIPGRGKKVFFITSREALGPTQSSIQRAPGAVSPEVKRQRREADHSPPSSDKVKNGGAMPPLPHKFSWRGA